MANIDLPGYNAVQAPGMGPTFDPSAAAAPWRALGQVGEAVQGLGEKGFQLAAKVQEAGLQTKAGEMTLELSKANAEYQAQIIKNPGDPSSWSDGYQKAIEPLRQKWLSDPNLPEPQRQQLTQHFNSITGQAANGIIRDSAVATFQNAKKAAGNVIEAGEAAGDDDLRMRGLELLRPLVPPADFEAVRARSDRNATLTKVTADIDRNPNDWKERLADPDAAKKYGIPVDDIPRLQGIQQQAERRVTFDAIGQAKDQIAANPNLQPEDLERTFGKKLSPSVMATLKQDLAQRDNFVLKTLHATEGYQQSTIGQVSALLDDYKVTDDKYDEKAAQIDSLIRSLPEDSASKATLSDWFNRVKSGQRMEIKNHADQARDVLMQRYKEGAFGKIDGKGEIEQEVAPLVNDGYIGDQAKMATLGFTPKQTLALATLDEGKLKDAG
ncbi:MAG: hypothetical protein JWO82_2158, partial [Akkermansiaceae bacterium]|nr:hypothetical protein [Akkermansiaceae bacterium]